MLKCPYCDGPLTLTAQLCPSANCGLTLPIGYVAVCRARPLLDVVIAGYSSHGKSEFLLSLMLTLNGIGQRLRGAMLSSGQPTEEVRRRYVQYDLNGTPVGTTQRGQGDRLEFGLRFVPPLADRFVRIQDTAGEVYQDREQVAAAVPRLKSAAAVWLVHSPFDQLNGRSSDTLESLFTAVHACFQRSQSAPTAARPRHLVVILSKADKLLPLIRQRLPDFPVDTPDPFHGIGITTTASRVENLAAHLAELREQSDALAEQMGQLVPALDSFVRLAREQHYLVSFTLVSALGGEPQAIRGQAQDKRKPVRVLAPLLLTLDAADRTPTEIPSVALVLDGTTDPGPVNQPAMAGDLATALADLATVTCYRLGQTAPASAAGQPPAITDDAPGRPRLIGPILDALPAGTRVAVLSNGPVLDLADQLRGPWAERLVLIRTDAAGSGGQGGWSKRLPFRAGDDAGVTARQILELTAPPPPSPAVNAAR